MFKAIWRYLRALGYAVTGRINKARETLAEDPNVAAATFDEAIEKKKAQVKEFMDAISNIKVLQKKKESELIRKREQLETAQRRQQGAKNKAKQRLEALGGDRAKAQADTEFIKWMGALEEQTGKVSTLTKEIAALEQSIKTFQGKIDTHLRRLEGLKRELKKYVDDKGIVVADLISAREETKMNEMLAGLSTNEDQVDLSGVYDARDRAQARAEISSAMAGTDTGAIEDELDAAAASAGVADSFFAELDADAAVEAGPTKPATDKAKDSGSIDFGALDD